MDDILKILKTEYNKVLERWDKATEYLENPIRTQNEIDKWLPEYEKILKQRNCLIIEIWTESGIKPTIEEYEGGFKA